MAVPDPGGAICTACGPVGSPQYSACNAQVTVGIIPACAAPSGGSVAPVQVGGGSSVATQPSQQTPTINQQATAQLATGTNDPWYCWLVPDQFKSTAGCSQPTGINWGDIGIRTGLVLVGVILLLIVVAKAIERPSVIVEK